MIITLIATVHLSLIYQIGFHAPHRRGCGLLYPTRSNGKKKKIDIDYIMLIGNAIHEHRLGSSLKNKYDVYFRIARQTTHGYSLSKNGTYKWLYMKM